jgi:hypothetical protein
MPSDTSLFGMLGEIKINIPKTAARTAVPIVAVAILIGGNH